jgi:hypothetical protein
MRDTTNLFPFTVRVEDGRELPLYVPSAEVAAAVAEIRNGQLAVLVLRGDEPFLRRPSRLRRLLDWWES